MNFQPDALDDLFGGERRAEPVAPPAFYAEVQARYSEPCTKCNGSGNYRNFGRCFACKGVGKKSFRTSPEARAANRASAAARQDRRAQEARAEFAAAYPDVAAWLAESTGFAFAVSLQSALEQWGSLTERQIEAARKCIAGRERARTERTDRIQNAPQVDAAGVDRLKEAFDKAAAYTAAKATGLTVRNPKITVAGITISPAKATSKNPGALYVKNGSTYLGKIAGGQFLATRECTEAHKAQVLAFVADPADAAKVYGQETGVCCVCNAALKSEWRLRGIGPICAQKFGW